MPVRTLPAGQPPRVAIPLELPPCDCDFVWSQDPETEAWHLSPCLHVLAALDHGHDLAAWQRLQRETDAASHSGRPCPRERTSDLPGTPAKVDVLMGRAAARQGLWHPGDATLASRDDQALDADVQPNGTPVDRFAGNEQVIRAAVLARTAAKKERARRG